MKQRILLGMSGGTDSSVAAILLLEQGYDVIGISFRFWDETNNQDIEDAINLAKKLGIDCMVYDARSIFKEKIVDYFVEEYLQGRTPFPCTKCNNELKWKLILQEADKLGCQKVAMGHYARIVNEKGLLYVAQGVDPDKDQSFFLWGLKQEQLARIILPLGKLYKKDIRKMAARNGLLKLANKKDSLGACFCRGDYRDFIVSQLENPEKYISEGDFVDEAGNVLGHHKGYPFYTVGQRRGLIHLNRKVYVKNIHSATNQIVLAPMENMYKTQFNIRNINVIDKTQFSEKFNTTVRIRYRKQNSLCRLIFKDQDEAIVFLHEPLESIAPGQTAVFYREEKILGGAFIQ